MFDPPSLVFPQPDLIDHGRRQQVLILIRFPLSCLMQRDHLRMCPRRQVTNNLKLDKFRHEREREILACLENEKGLKFYLVRSDSVLESPSNRFPRDHPRDEIRKPRLQSRKQRHDGDLQRVRGVRVQFVIRFQNEETRSSSSFPRRGFRSLPWEIIRR